MVILALLLQAAPCPNPDALPQSAASARCEGLMLTTAARWRQAAMAFESAAKAVNSERAAALWAQAGNAWLAAGEPMRAASALDAALVWSGGLSAGAKAEMQVDRARAAVAAGDLDVARAVLDQAFAGAPAEPLTWLLSATLARRMGQPARAANDIAEVLKRAPEDAAVQLEAGNIAALAGEVERAKERWAEAARLQPDGEAGRSAKVALAQFQ